MSTDDTTPAGSPPAEDDDTTPAGSPPAEDDDTTPAGSPPADDDAEDDDAEDDAAEDDAAEDDADDDADTFPRSYVKRLRERSAGYRTRANAAETRVAALERDLFTERVKALDVLADPSDLPFDADMLDDADALRTAAEDLVRRRPHYRRRGVATGTGSRHEATPADTTSLLGIMRGGA